MTTRTDRRSLEDPPEEIRVKRDGDRDLAFSGWILGIGTQLASEYQRQGNLSSSRGTQVVIYLTRGRQIVTSVKQWEKQSERTRDTHRGAAHKTPKAALEWLRKDAGGELGRASKSAWEEACATWPELEAEDVERID